MESNGKGIWKNMSEMSENKKRDIPVWMGILLIIVALLGAGWFVWSQTSGFWSAPSGVFTIEGVEPGARPQPQARRQFQNQPAPQANIREISKTQWRTRTPAYTLDTKQEAGKLNMVVSASSMRVLPDDAQWIVVSRGRLDDQAGAAIGLSAAQMSQFKALPTNIRHELTLTDAQLKQIQDPFRKYLDALPPQKVAAAQEVSVALNLVGQAATPALAQRIAATYETYKKSITPDQWAKLKQLASTAPVGTVAK